MLSRLQAADVPVPVYSRIPLQCRCTGMCIELHLSASAVNHQFDLIAPVRQ